MNISYAITVCNEDIEFKKLLQFLNQYITETDEIIILCDISKVDLDLDKFAESFQKTNIKFHKDIFSNDFAAWKNKLNSLCSKDYIFQIDADELPNPGLMTNLKPLLLNNPDIELIWIPRENYVDGITEDHIKLWRWNLDFKNRINFPDYQGRIYKNSQTIYWAGKVHETIHGAKTIANLPPVEECSLLHRKTITKQEKQNSLYEKLN